MIPLMMARTADVDGSRLYSAVREKVLENSRKMTRYMCVETMGRSQFLAGGSGAGCGAAAKRGRVAQRDRVRLDVTVVNGGEIFAWTGARRCESRDVQKLARNRATVTGEFGGFLRGAFSHPPDIPTRNSVPQVNGNQTLGRRNGVPGNRSPKSRLFELTRQISGIPFSWQARS